MSENEEKPGYYYQIVGGKVFVKWVYGHHPGDPLSDHVITTPWEDPFDPRPCPFIGQLTETDWKHEEDITFPPPPKEHMDNQAIAVPMGPLPDGRPPVEFPKYRKEKGKAFKIGKLFYLYREKGCFFFRFFNGYGLWGRSLQVKSIDLFSERYGLVKYYRVFGWKFKILKPEPRLSNKVVPSEYKPWMTKEELDEFDKWRREHPVNNL